MIPDIGKNGHETGKADSGFGTAHKQTVVPVLCYPTDLTLADIVRQVEAAILQTTQHTRIFLQGIVNCLKKFRFVLLLKVPSKPVQVILQVVVLIFTTVKKLKP